MLLHIYRRIKTDHERTTKKKIREVFSPQNHRLQRLRTSAGGTFFRCEGDETSQKKKRKRREETWKNGRMEGMVNGGKKKKLSRSEAFLLQFFF